MLSSPVVRSPFVRSLSFGFAAGLAFAPTLAAQVFGPPRTTVLPQATRFGPIAIGDVDRDGDLDVVAADIERRTFTLLGDGAGQLAAPITGRDGVGLLADTHLLDLDGDGRLDLLLGGLTSLRWLAGDGTGSFFPVADLTGLGSRVCVADVDGDGRPDLIGRPNTLVVAHGSPTGPLPPSPLRVPADAGLPFSQSGALAGDLDGDRHLDVLFAGLGPPVALFGDGAGGFDRATAAPTALIFPRALCDFDGDGDLDVLAEHPAGGPRIGCNDGTGNFATVQILPGAAPTALRTAAAVDLDGDGGIDVLTIEGNAIVALRSDGHGGFAPPERHAVGAIDTFAVGDFDADGRTDVVVLGGSLVHLLRNELPIAPTLVAYGSGTPTCRGTIGLTGNRAPTLGAASFAILCSNAPPNATGLLAIGTRATAGHAPLGLDLVLHLGVAWPLGAMRSDSGGAASFGIALPQSPWLAGLTVHAQSFWVGDAGAGDTCSRGRGELASSRGLSITLQR